MQDSALYYPSINFNDPSLIKSMAMFYDNIYRIVPSDHMPEDDRGLQSLLEDSRIGRPIDPLKYSKKASDEFLIKKESWIAAALDPDPSFDNNLTRIHSDKTDEKVKQLFNELGFKDDEDWMYVPTDLASNYMLYLSKHISEKNNLQLITSDFAPWTATTYYRLNGGVNDFIQPYEINSKYINDPFALYSLVINNLSPVNISEIPGHKIIEFREKRQDEINNFRNAILEIHEQLQILDDEYVIADKINQSIRNFQKAQKDYQKSADMINVKGWSGFSLMGIPASIAMGDVFTGLTSLVSGLAGLSFSGMYNITNSKQELEQLRKNNPISCIMDINRDFNKYMRRAQNADANYYAYQCMEEYIND